MVGRYLVVDDNRPTREMIGALLDTLGQEIEEATDGNEAIEMLQSRSYDGLILDILMPGKDGFEVLNWMMKSGRVFPTVVFTETGEKFSARFPKMAESLGALKSFDKPITLEKLEEALVVMQEAKH